MPPERYTPTQAARQAGISPNTVRVWAKEYRDFLSEYANPPAGVDRSFTPTDVATIQAITQLRANNLSTADVKERLRQQPPQAPDTLQDATKAADVAPDSSTASTALAPAHDAIQAFLARNDVTDKLESIDRRLERVESRSNLVAAVVVAVVVAFAAGGALVWLIMSR